MNSLVNFTKMHGLGNDFIVMDTIHQYVPIAPNLIKQLCHRRFGVGADQVLIVEPPVEPTADFFVRIFNADGQEVGQCLNGLRCVGRYIREQFLSDKSDLVVDTQSGRMLINTDHLPAVSVRIPPPKLEPDSIPTTLKPHALGFYQHPTDPSLEFWLVYVGNPHAIVFVSHIEAQDLKETHKKLINTRAFPEGLNTSLVQVIALNHAKIQTFERGVGPTYACGSAACAAVVAGRLCNQFTEKVQISTQSGSLNITWENNHSPITIEGPTNSTFNGQFVVQNTFRPHTFSRS